ncbi:P-loop NTPase [Acidithiobacillus sp.]|uniref:ParA family protein n=1 Tax=Acidithiobacillus sp. TaxID=1872118 RepID=UPI002583B9CB|nr:P-loop NTPase [Acidithiobacillus sp.]MDD5374989.1 AAA family ATPase [Acidithiobacillus sp.]
MRKKLFELFPEPIPTFDRILPEVQDWLKAYSGSLNDLLSNQDDWLLVNRDLNGRVRLILPERIKESKLRGLWDQLASDLMRRLGRHAYPKSAEILFETNLEQAVEGATSYSIDGFTNVWMVDRLATEANWARITPETEGTPRIVFFSIKGGVGRSTALAATAWSLAQAGKRVLVLDLDLESPGLSSALLPTERQPMYGITDWLVEDLVDNGDAVFDSMVATSNLSHDGEIHVVPAHGAEHGEYIAKLGRVWMPKLQEDGTRETWSARLGRLLQALEARIQPDVVLIDSRSGIDEIASACITDMGANLILLFALEGEQTWNGYRMLFEQWQRAHVAETIRERLKIVGAIVPEMDRLSYLEGLREHAYGVFVDTLYDEIAPPKPDAVGSAFDRDGKWRVGDLVEGWNFDEADEGGPHYPWAVNWHRSFAGLRSLQGRLAVIDVQEVNAIFSSLLDGVRAAAGVEGRS